MRDGKYVVLCIDDDEDIRECLQIILEENDYIPVLAESAEDGYRVYEETKPDLIIVDMMMEIADSGIAFTKIVEYLISRCPGIFHSLIGSAARHFNLKS